MANVLQQCFPEIRTREAVIREISESEKLRSVWVKWNDQQQNVIDAQKEDLSKQEEVINAQKKEIEELKARLAENMGMEK